MGGLQAIYLNRPAATTVSASLARFLLVARGQALQGGFGFVLKDVGIFVLGQLEQEFSRFGRGLMFQDFNGADKRQVT
jgi:hypothetical protein